MRIDITYPLGEKDFKALAALAPRDKALSQIDLFGHVGTHLDLMGKSYPDDCYATSGRLFDVRNVSGRDIGIGDVDLPAVREREFVIFHTGCLASFAYGSKAYVFAPIQLSWGLIHALAAKKVALIGVDLAGVRLPGEHPKADEFCAGQGVFIVENLYNLQALADAAGNGTFTAHTYPLRLEGATGLPCRIIAEA
ncbi:MAG: cyclase family protein [Planctomycetota bacterium]|nr:cyclase family protein [Planctomycetota bacterium]